jgi:uncharacterized membrane protein
MVSTSSSAGLARHVRRSVACDPESLIDRLAFQGTGAAARALLITVSSTVVTVIALVLGLTVVALQLSSTQFRSRPSVARSACGRGHRRRRVGGSVPTVP